MAQLSRSPQIHKKQLALIAIPMLIVMSTFQNCSQRSQTVETIQSSQSNPSVVADSTALTQSMFSAAKTLLGRLPTAAEINRVSREGFAGYQAIVKDYIDDPTFRQAMVREHQNYLGIGGQVAGSSIDYDLPARLGTYLIINELDYTQVITANYGVDANFQRTALLDPFPDVGTSSANGAGILTTRAYIASLKDQKGFNFLLVKDSFEKFSCAAYPDQKEEYPTPKAEVSSAVHPWGTSNACYACHQSMNTKSYLYYFYDKQGVFVPSGVGTTRTDTNSVSNIGHVLTTGSQPRLGGQPAPTMRAFGAHMAQDSRFGPCMVKRYVNFMLGKSYKDPLPEGLDHLNTQFAASFYNVKKLLLDISLSQAYISRGVAGGTQ